MAENRRDCASCGTTNEEDARFCEGCGGSLARICATCGVEASATARFCRGCGASLDSRKAAPDGAASGPVRKTVTVMFADLVGSTTFEEKVDAETARDVIGRYHDLLRSIAQRHRAGVTKYIGDGFMAVWGVPEIGPDDAAHAVDAAVELQERFVDLAAQVAESHSAELALRVAVNTGEVVVGAGDADLVGDALNVGARLEAECPRGHVVVGEETWRATRGRYDYDSLGQVQVKGRTAPVAVYQWLGRQTDTADAAPFVGRRDEVRRLQAVLDDAIAARQARLVTVTGDPGVGKSRLAAEFTGAHGDARVVEARCVLEGTVALAPLVEVLGTRDLESDVPAGVPERDRLLRDLNGLMSGVAGSVEENFWALRRFVEVLATDQPVLLVIDDIQWADALLIDFIEHLVEWVQEVPVLVLALARPELRETRPDLVTVSRWVSEAVHLGGLDASATAELAAKVLGAARLPDDLLRRLPSSTGGNPLFVRELVGMLAHDGVLVERPTGWLLTIDVDAITIPPTIHALLASRLERLAAAERRLLEIASVVGSDFSLGAVRALAGGNDAGVELSLNRLRRLELAQPSGAYIGDEPVWRFHHVLIRDVAYRRLLKSERADLHERLADWLEQGGAGGALDADEVVARHLEAAQTYRRELGTVDAHTGDLALRAARHYASSARRALDRDELVSSGMQAARGAALAAADAALHSELLLIGCEAFLSAGDVAAGAPLVDDLDRIADDALSPWATCYRCQFIVYTDPERLLDVDARLQGAIDEFGRRRDHAGLAKAHRVRAGARSRLGRIGDCEADLFEALIAARQSGDHRQITAALGAAPSAALWGPSPVPKAGGRCLDVVRMQRMTTAAPSLEATSLRCLAVLELLRGRPDKARTMLADARQVVADLGLRHGLMETELFAGIIESMEGDPVAAEPHFRTALEGLEALGAGADAGQAAALLAKSVLAQGRIEEADTHAAESERLAGRNLKTAIAWRAVRAEISAAQGRHDAATAMARDAVAVAAGTDLVLDHAEACLALSRVLAAAGDAHGANAARVNAEQLYAAKEVATSIARTVPAADSSPSPPPPSTTSASSRLAVKNPATDTGYALIEAMRAHDIDAAAALYSDRVTHDDRRRLSGDPIEGPAEVRAALERLLEQYSHFESRMLAVRGEHLTLSHNRWSDDAGNETTDLIVAEVDDGGQIIYQGRFDEDFEAAYRELERRYYAGEGAAFAENGLAASVAPFAMDRGDFDRVFGELSTPELHVENHSRSAFPDRSAKDLRASSGELSAMFVSMRSWMSAMSWLSPTWSVGRMEREAIGQDGELYTWSMLLATEHRDGRFVSMAQFDPEDEEAAFAYAEERIRATTSRLTVSNRASKISEASWSAMQAHDVDHVVADYADEFVYDDRRRLSGDPVTDRAGMRAAFERVFAQFTMFEARTLAVRGERSALRWSSWSDDAGNRTDGLFVLEINDGGRTIYAGRFDEDDFENAYRALDQRYYAEEGAAFAAGGGTLTDYITALNRGDLVKALEELVAPDARIENRSRSVFGDRSASEFRASVEELNAMIATSRTWHSAVVWLSPTWAVLRAEREAVGHDGELYTWTRAYVIEIRDRRATSLCEFEIDDEDAVFAYAEERIRATTSRLAVDNRSCDTARSITRALQAHDIDGILTCCVDPAVHDDRRRLTGDPIHGNAEFRAAFERILQQYSRFEMRILAVRGDRLNLHWSRWSDEAGNESAYLHVFEIGDDGLLVYEGRFDEDDFDSAYRELERRYYAGEGAGIARADDTVTEWLLALNRKDFDRIFGELTSTDFRALNKSRSAFPDRSAAEYRITLQDLAAMVASSRVWNSAEQWLSPACGVFRSEREAVGIDGQRFAWSWIIVAEIRGGQASAMCEFEVDDEESAFAYAEERMRAIGSRLAVTNRASENADDGFRKIRAHDVEALIACYSEQFVYDDRRRLKGDPLVGRAALRAAVERIVGQYPNVEWRTLAVRGERLALDRSRWTDDDGNETAYLHVFEIDGDGRITYDGRFDEDDFEGAYCELEHRYQIADGIEFAQASAVATEHVIAYNQGDFDRMLGELNASDMRFENRSRSAFPDRSVAEFRASIDELSTMVASSRAWYSVSSWLSPGLCVLRFEREAVGPDGEQYAWTRLYVNEYQDGRGTSSCQFDLEDEDAAFAYAEERVRATESRLRVTNRAGRTAETLVAAMNASDLEASLACFSDSFVYDDHRRLSGGAIRGLTELRVTAERILAQYSRFEARILAIRGDRLALDRGRWSNDAGYETIQLSVNEVDANGQIIRQIRFDEDDFEGAYRELEQRYYAAEGSTFADVGAWSIEFWTAINRHDYDRLFGELTTADMRVEGRSRSSFPDRSAAELRASLEELNAMVASSREWHPVVHWLSPAVIIARDQREAVGREGEQYAWDRIIVTEVRNRRATSMCVFELDDEEAAFAYADELVQAGASRLAVVNRCLESVRAIGEKLQAHDVDGVMAHYSDRFVYDDHRRLGGAPVNGTTELRVAFERICQQYNRFEGDGLAVRGQRLELSWSRWSDDAGNETSYLHVFESGDDDLIVYEGRFDEDDFNGAYRELEERYYAGEGAAFTEAGIVATEVSIALNQGDLDRIFGELLDPDMRFKIRSRSAFPERSATELRASLEEFDAWVVSTRSWHSAMHWLSPRCCVARNEREAVGRDGEKYAWTRLYVTEMRDGRGVASCEFEIDDEEAAFAYAEERVRATASRLPLTNRASEITHAMTTALGDHDIDGAFTYVSAAYVYDDRRKISGDPIHGTAQLKVAVARILEQYNQFERRTLAVRGQLLELNWSRWSDDSHNETAYLHVFEVSDDGPIVYEGRFDEDDFDSAYRELDRRYYAGEGAAFAEAGAVETDYNTAYSQGDVDRIVGELSSPDLQLENRSRSAFPDRSAAEFLTSTKELHSMVSAVRMWSSAVCWLSPSWCVLRSEREAVGKDGEPFAWTRIFVGEVRAGRITTLCQFDVADEDAAFAYAQERLHAADSRLAVTNRASETLSALSTAMRAHDIDRAVGCYSESYVYADRRRISGDPIRGRAEMRVAFERLLSQFTDNDWVTLAVRGPYLQVVSTRFSDVAGNATTGLTVCEVDGDGLFSYQVRFDDDDFDGAYRELNQRYYTGHGAAFAEAGAIESEYSIAYNQRDFDRMIDELSSPDFRLENRSRSAFPDRSVAEFRASSEELVSMVSTVRMWSSAVYFVSPTWCVSRNEREAFGKDGEHFTWTRIIVAGIRDGRVASMCVFELDDEEAAFAYAEQKAHAARRLPITNRASDIAEALLAAMQAHNVDEVAAHYSNALVYDDRRRLAGVPFSDMRTAMERVLEQYTQFEGRILAVRGERTYLGWTRWSNEAGFETSYLGVQEISDDGRFVYQGRFDEDDFDSAYRVLDDRYYAGEGAAFAQAGVGTTERVIAMNERNLDRLFGELIPADLHIENRSRSVFGNRTPAELRTSIEELFAMVDSTRTWYSAVRWVSPQCILVREQREAVGRDGERYSWTRLYALEFRGEQITAACQFEIEDEEAAFAYAEERALSAASRLSLTNLASRAWEAGRLALQTRDIDAARALYTEPFVFDDRRRLSGNPLDDLRTAQERIVAQYSHFEGRTLAVRGERLHLGWTRWSNESGFETSYLMVHEVDEHGLFIYEGRFDEDNFEDAYRELERRYYAGDGAAFAEAGATITDYLVAMDRGDTDQLFGQLTAPGLRLENRSRAPFGDRSFDEFRATEKDLHALVASTRSWSSAMYWVSPTVVVGRFEREAVGPDGEQYAWCGIYVDGVRDRRLESVRLFEVDDEAAAFAYAEERVRQAGNS